MKVNFIITVNNFYDIYFTIFIDISSSSSTPSSSPTPYQIKRMMLPYRMAEVMIQGTKNGHGVGTPLMDGTSMFGRLSHVNLGYLSIQSQFGLGRSKTSMNSFKIGLRENKDRRYKSFLRDVLAMPFRIIGIIMDNFNPSQFIRLDKLKYRRFASLNSIMRGLVWNESDINSAFPFVTEYDYGGMCEWINEMADKDYMDDFYDGIDLKVEEEDPRLSDFEPVPLTKGQSSKADDIKKNFMEATMEKDLHVKDTPTVLVTDPEPYCSVSKMLETDSELREKWAKLIMVPGIFHLRNHLVKGELIDDFSSNLLLYDVAMQFWKESDLDRPKLHNQLLAKLEKRSKWKGAPISPQDKIKIKFIKHHLKNGPLPDGDVDESDVFWPEKKGLPAPSDADMKELMILHLCEVAARLIPSEDELWGKSDGERKELSITKDLKKGIRCLRTVSKCWKKLVADGDVPESDDNPALIALNEIISEVDMAIQPFDDIFIQHDATLLFKSMLKLICKLGYDRHPILLRGYIPFLNLLNYWKKTNPAIITFIAFNLKSMNDAFIEHFNSKISRTSAKGGKLSFESTALDVESAPVRSSIEEQLGIKKSSKGELRNEFIQEPTEEQEEDVTAVLRSKIGLYQRLGPYLEGVGRLQPSKLLAGMARLLESMEARGHSDFNPESPMKILGDKMCGFDPKCNLQLWKHALEEMEDHLNPPEEVDVEDALFDFPKTEDKYVPTPPSNPDDLAYEIASILLKEGIVEEDGTGFEEWMDRIGVEPEAKTTRGRPKKKRTQKA